MTQAARNASSRLGRDRSGGQSGFQLAGFLFLLVVLAMIGWCGWVVVDWMKNSEQVPLSKLVITGQRTFTTDSDIRKVILSQGELKTFMTQDVDALQQEIKLQLPWVRQVSIRKHWPDELAINIVEFQPFAYWNENFFIDAEGRQFTLPIERLNKKTLPFFYGPTDRQQMVLDSYHEMNHLLDAVHLKLGLVSFSSRYSWMLILDNGIKLELGQQDRILRLKRFITLYPLLVEQTPPKQRINYVDMRYKSGAAVGYTPII
jgi:cell division protein FtsQ